MVLAAGGVGGQAVVRVAGAVVRVAGCCGACCRVPWSVTDKMLRARGSVLCRVACAQIAELLPCGPDGAGGMYAGFFGSWCVYPWPRRSVLILDDAYLAELRLEVGAVADGPVAYARAVVVDGLHAVAQESRNLLAVGDAEAYESEDAQLGG